VRCFNRERHAAQRRPRAACVHTRTCPDCWLSSSNSDSINVSCGSKVPKGLHGIPQPVYLSLPCVLNRGVAVLPLCYRCFQSALIRRHQEHHQAALGRNRTHGIAGWFRRNCFRDLQNDVRFAYSHLCFSGICEEVGRDAERAGCEWTAKKLTVKKTEPFSTT
jgi:hypothetical protein